MDNKLFFKMNENYHKNLKKFEMQKTDYDEIDYMIKKFVNNKIKC